MHLFPLSDFSSQPNTEVLRIPTSSNEIYIPVRRLKQITNGNPSFKFQAQKIQNTNILTFPIDQKSEPQVSSSLVIKQLTTHKFALYSSFPKTFPFNFEQCLPRLLDLNLTLLSLPRFTPQLLKLQQSTQPAVNVAATEQHPQSPKATNQSPLVSLVPTSPDKKQASSNINQSISASTPPYHRFRLTNQPTHQLITPTATK